MRLFTFIGFLLAFLLAWSSPSWANDNFDEIGVSKKMKIELEKLARQSGSNPDSAIINGKALLKELPIDQKYARARVLRILGNANLFLNNERQALEYFEQSMSIYRELDLKSGVGAVLHNIGIIRERQNDYGGAVQCFIEAALLFGEDNNTEYLGTVYIRLGNIYNILGRMDKSLEYHALALNIHEKANDSIRTVHSYNNLGNVYLGLKDYKKALLYYNRSVVMCRSIEYDEILPTLYNNMGLAHEGLEEYTKALDYYRLAIELARKTNNLEVRVSSLMHTGVVYITLNENDRAMVALMEAQRLVSSMPDRYLKATVAASMAHLYLKEERFDEAIASYMESLSLSKGINSFPMFLEVYYGIAEAFQGKKDFKRACEYLDLHKKMADSVYDTQSNERLNLLRVGFESQTIERENQLLKQQNIFSQLALERQRTIRNLLIVISVIVVLSAFFLYSLYQAKNEKNILLAERNLQVVKQKDELNHLYKEQYKLNETKNKFFSIIAHDLKSPFQSILGFSELLSFEYENLTDQQRIDSSKNILKVSNETFRLIENLLEWGRTQTGTANATLKVFNVRDLVLKTLPVFDPQLSKKGLKITTDLPPLLQAWADPDMIMAVIRNLVSNAIKFSPPGSEINIHSRINQNRVYLSVVNSGEGIPQEVKERLFTLDPKVQRAGTLGERGTGLGLALCKEFMELNDGDIEFESEQGQGSMFSIVMQTPGNIKNE